jgi:hypothetical protein
VKLPPPGRTAAALVAAVASVVALVGLAAPAHALPTITLVPTLDPSYPLQVPSAAGETNPILFTVTTSEPVDVTATASGTGLVAAPVALGTVSGAKGFSMAVRGTAAGFHTLTVTVTADGLEPVSVDLSNVWTTGSALPAPRDSLAGRAYGWSGPGSTSDLLSFVSKDYAFRGLPAYGRPTCKNPASKKFAGCVPYSYDTTTGLVQVGTDLIGRVVGSGLFTSGFAHGVELFTPYEDREPLSYADRGRRYSGKWSYEDSSRPGGITVQKVRFSRSGRVRLVWQDAAGTHRLNGDYAVGRKGRITFRRGGKVRERGTLLEVGHRVGRGKRGALGLWLVIDGRRDAATDGNLLTRGRRR